MPALDAPLSDVRVIELGHIVAGPFCSLLLADLGAEVIKVERPGTGEIYRGGSRAADSVFNSMNRNKKSLTLDLKTPDGTEIMHDLVASADVIVENFRPGTLESLGLGYDDLTTINPGIIVCSIKGFAPGPYEDKPALDPVAEALSGLMSRTGYPDHPPARCGASVADMTASLYGALAVAGALRQRDHTGDGQHITAPLFEATTTLMGPALAHADLYDEVLGPMGGGGHGGGTWSPYGVFQTADEKWLFLGPSSQQHWLELCRVLDLDLVDDERFETLPDRLEHKQTLHEILRGVIREYTQPEFLALFEGENVPVAPVQNTKEAVNDPHLNASGALVQVQTAEGTPKTIRVPGNPVVSTAYDTRTASDPPRLSEHTDDILRDLGYSDDDLERFKTDGVL